ncbi:uncharacterized protein LOC116796832 [Chiroxiphia lanceolata]|uniref:uncharacterized protein LOC116796832 n=1 Tax=Chiroxiphia lanceolata TaxID=296741 RepID=UPI0013CE8236|nr:uncharacterized protein LOC116796832 [Chiroxiphia lanceolata]
MQLRRQAQPPAASGAALQNKATSKLPSITETMLLILQETTELSRLCRRFTTDDIPPHDNTGTGTSSATVTTSTTSRAAVQQPAQSTLGIKLAPPYGSTLAPPYGSTLAPPSKALPTSPRQAAQTGVPRDHNHSCHDTGVSTAQQQRGHSQQQEHQEEFTHQHLLLSLLLCCFHRSQSFQKTETMMVELKHITSLLVCETSKYLYYSLK